jgi:ribosomal-protein-alanine N-acetyltransferase
MPSVATTLDRLARQRRIFDRLDWWRMEEWLASDAWAVARNHEAALLVVPLDLEPGLPLSAARHPVAWVRWCAVADGASAGAAIRALCAEAELRLAPIGVRAMWCIGRERDWHTAYLHDLGFHAMDRVLTYRLSTRDLRARAAGGARGGQVRSAGQGDLGAICALDAEAFEPQWHYPRAIMARALSRADAFTVIEDSGRIAGYQCSLRGVDPDTELSGATGGHVVRLAVRPDARRRGLGRALLEDAIARFAQGGAECVTLNTPESNRGAQALYRELGFRAIAERPRAYRKTLPATVTQLTTEAPA